jgi:hypothetical protein
MNGKEGAMTTRTSHRWLAVCLSLSLGILSADIAAREPDAKTKTLSAAQAQKSPQADVFLAYEKALVWEGIDAASAYMTPEKLADMKGMVQQFGEDGFKDFQARMRETVPKGEERRKTIEKLEVDGDKAVLEARSGPHAVDVVRLAKTKDGWKIAR